MIYFKKLHDLKLFGVVLSEKYTIESNINKMKTEYSMHVDILKFNRDIKCFFTIFQSCVDSYIYFNNKYKSYDEIKNAIKEFLLLLMKYILNTEYRKEINNNIINMYIYYVILLIIQLMDSIIFSILSFSRFLFNVLICT